MVVGNLNLTHLFVKQHGRERPIRMRGNQYACADGGLARQRNKVSLEGRYTKKESINLSSLMILFFSIITITGRK